MKTLLTQQELDELRAKAEAADEESPGPWQWDKGWDVVAAIPEGESRISEKYAGMQLLDSEGCDIIPLRIDHYEPEWDTATSDEDGGFLPCKEVRDFIATANPQVVLALLDEIERLRATMPKVTQIGNTITVDTPVRVKLPRVGEP